MFIEEVVAALNEAHVPFAVVGGYAVALHGFPRGTVDVDIVLQWTEEHLLQAEKALKKLGLVSRIPVDAKMIFQFKEEYIRNRNLVAWNFYDPIRPSRSVDIILTYELNADKDRVMKQSIPVLSKKKLIKMKRASGRPQDLEDIKFLEQS